MNEPAPLESRDSSNGDLSRRVAALEGTMASSWACQTKDQYEKDFREQVKQEVMTFAFKLAAGLAVFIGGVGLIFIKSQVISAYQSENKKVVADLQDRYASHVKSDMIRLEWARYHNYGVVYRDLAELYASLNNLDEATRSAKIQKAFDRAESYYNRALEHDARAASTYFELGELHNTLARQYGLRDWVDDPKALDLYREAARYYTPAEIENGWRADTYLRMGTILLVQAKQSASEAERVQRLKSAEEYLTKARAEYQAADPALRKRFEADLRQTETLLTDLYRLTPDPHQHEGTGP